jgi:hypothetical protein
MKREEGWLLQRWTTQELRLHATERGLKFVQWRDRGQWTTNGPADFDGIIGPLAEKALREFLLVRASSVGEYPSEMVGARLAAASCALRHAAKMAHEFAQHALRDVLLTMRAEDVAYVPPPLPPWPKVEPPSPPRDPSPGDAEQF